MELSAGEVGFVSDEEDEGGVGGEEDEGGVEVVGGVGGARVAAATIVGCVETAFRGRFWRL